MFIRIRSVLAATDVRFVLNALKGDDAFEDGAKTAGSRARAVKHNEQARPSGMVGKACRLIEKRLLSHDTFRAAARPKSIIRLLLARYRPGMSYGWHVDDALIDDLRADLSFTIFLADPDAYDGGDLIIDEPAGEQSIRLDAGDLILYPASTRHCVSEVTRGERIAAVGWVRSHVREEAAREVLFELAVVRQQAVVIGDRGLADRLDRINGLLLRRWLED